MRTSVHPGVLCINCLHTIFPLLLVCRDDCGGMHTAKRESLAYLYLAYTSEYENLNMGKISMKMRVGHPGAWLCWARPSIGVSWHRQLRWLFLLLLSILPIHSVLTYRSVWIWSPCLSSCHCPGNGYFVMTVCGCRNVHPTTASHSNERKWGCPDLPGPAAALARWESTEVWIK